MPDGPLDVTASYDDLLRRGDAPPGSTWGLFDPSSERGMADLAGPEQVLAAASLVALGVLRRVLVRLGTAGLALADTPTVVIVLGPFGQSVTAANLLAGEAQGLLPEPFAGLAIGAGLLYGAPAWGFAAGWTVLSAVLIGHALRRGCPSAPPGGR